MLYALHALRLQVSFEYPIYYLCFFFYRNFNFFVYFVPVSYDMRVVRTRNIDHTIQILEAITLYTTGRFHRGQCFFKLLQQSSNPNFAFVGQTVETPLYLTMDHFKKITTKREPKTVFDILVRQIRQIHGCSAAAVNALMDAFGPSGPFHGFPRTHVGFLQAMQSKDSVSIKRIIADLVKAEDGMRLGPKLADMIYTFFTR